MPRHHGRPERRAPEPSRCRKRCRGLLCAQPSIILHARAKRAFSTWLPAGGVHEKFTLRTMRAFNTSYPDTLRGGASASSMPPRERLPTTVFASPRGSVDSEATRHELSTNEHRRSTSNDNQPSQAALTKVGSRSCNFNIAWGHVELAACAIHFTFSCFTCRFAHKWTLMLVSCRLWRLASTAPAVHFLGECRRPAWLAALLFSSSSLFWQWPSLSDKYVGELRTAPRAPCRRLRGP